MKENAAKEDIIAAGERLLLKLCGEHTATSLNEARYRKFSKKCGTQVSAKGGVGFNSHWCLFH